MVTKKRTSDKDIFMELLELTTEKRNPRTMDIDSKPTLQVLKLINEEDKTVPYVVEKEIPWIKKAVDIIVECLKKGGRLFYVGAGTSGRLGVLDAAECQPTFGTPPELVQGIIAGGKKALTGPIEGAEDRDYEGREAIIRKNIGKNDVVVGITASRRTPFVLEALKTARERGARTIFLTCNPRDEVKKRLKELKLKFDVLICPVVGPEVIMGSTRMKAGTAQKLILNMLSTTTFIRLAKVYENMMVDLRVVSRKLIERAKRTIMFITKVDYESASELLKRAKGNVKTALVMHIANVGYREAQKLLKASDGFVRKAIELHKRQISRTRSAP